MTQASDQRLPGIVVPSLARVFDLIQRLNILYLIMELLGWNDLPREADRTPIDKLVDWYVLTWTVAAVALYCFSFCGRLEPVWTTIVLCVALARTIEIVTFHLSFLIV